MEEQVPFDANWNEIDLSSEPNDEILKKQLLKTGVKNILIQKSLLKLLKMLMKLFNTSINLVQCIPTLLLQITM